MSDRAWSDPIEKFCYYYERDSGITTEIRYDEVRVVDLPNWRAEEWIMGGRVRSALSEENQNDKGQARDKVTARAIEAVAHGGLTFVDFLEALDGRSLPWVYDDLGRVDTPRPPPA